MRQLDDAQLAAVTGTQRALLVRAQVGSGKTTVLTCRVAWLHAVVGVPLERIAVLTFTNRAAAEIRARVGALLGDRDGVGNVDRQLALTGTFHSVARTLLARRLPIQKLGFRRGFSILDDADRMALWRRLIAQHGLAIRHQKHLSKRMLALATGTVLHGNMRRPDDIVRLAELAHTEKLRRNAMDFDDLIDNAHGLLCEHPISPPLQCILIDELQDCDADQLALVHRMTGPDTQVFAVGDPNQLIYSWRGSDADVFERFAATWQAETMTLRASYRCPPEILGPAQQLLTRTGPAVAPASPADELRAKGTGGQPVRVMPHHDDAAQARWCAAQIGAALTRGVDSKDVAVLGRTRRSIAAISKALADADIPVFDGGSEKRLDQPVVAWLYGLLRAGLVGEDDEAFCIALTDRRFGLCSERTLTVDRLQRCRDGGDVEPRNAVLRSIGRRARGRRQADAAVAIRVTSSLSRLPELVASARDGATEPLLDALGLAEMLRPTSSQFATYWPVVVEFMGAWLTEVEASESIDQPGLLRALETAAHAPNVTERSGVAVLTMHAAKGLEFDHVIIASCNDGLLPLAAAWRDPLQLAEERRLLFVAITRACKSVDIGWLKAPSDRRVQPDPSPLLELLGDDALQWLDAPPEAAPTAATRALPRFAVGDRVDHPRYGEGHIVLADSEAIVARFAKLGDKRFSARLCPLTARP